VERGSVGRAIWNAAGAIVLIVWVVAIVTVMVLVSMGYLWPGEVPAGLVPWLGGVLMLGGLAVYGLLWSSQPVRPAAGPESAPAGRSAQRTRGVQLKKPHG
jgi:hypothetical protein